MADTDQMENEALRRMLNTPHENHKPLGRKSERRKPVKKPE
jgi:hypothetical protein